MSKDRIAEAWLTLQKAVAVYGLAEADVAGVPETMPQVAIEAAGLVWDAARTLALAVVEECRPYSSIKYPEAYDAIRTRIEALR